MLAELGIVGLLGVFLVLVLIFFLVALFMWGLKYAIAYAINAVIGFFALYAIQAFVAPSLVINIWSVSLVAIFGLLGFLIVLLLHWAGWMF